MCCSGEIIFYVLENFQMTPTKWCGFVVVMLCSIPVEVLCKKVMFLVKCM